jgi:hypothetical protein
MSFRWIQPYELLKEFVAGHPEIEIGETIARIPEPVRKEFYRLFDQVRLTFVEEHLPCELLEADRLGRAFIVARKEVREILKLDSISVPDDLSGFLRDPRKSLAEGLFDPLFGLLRGRSDIQAFEEEGSRRLLSTQERLYRLGYQAWVELRTVKLLEPDRILDVPLADPGYVNKIKRSFPFKEPLPLPRETNRLSLIHEVEPTFVVSDFIVHSARVRRFVAIRSEFEDAMWAASDRSTKREWLSMEKVKVFLGTASLRPGLCLYVGLTPKEVALAADSQSVCRPDLVIECAPRGLKEEDAAVVGRYRYALRPKLGVTVACGEPLRKDVKEGLAGAARVIVANLDGSKLDPIARSLRRPRRKRAPRMR